MLQQFGLRVTAESPRQFVFPGRQYHAVASYPVEPDASSASYFWAAAAVTGGRVTVTGLTAQSLQGDVRFVEVLEDMTGDWDIEFSGKIGEATLLVGDLAFESIDVVHLIVTLGEVLGQKDLGFERILMEDGRYVSDLSVAQIADFLTETLAEREAR